MWSLVLTGATAASALPHIIQISVDDVGYADGTYNSNVTDIPTPNINSLLAEGVRLTKYYTQMVCSPTRSSFLTGMYPFRFGFQQTNPQAPASTATVPTSVPFVSEKLKAVGYTTAAIGKWHVGYASPSYTPLYRGFDTYLGYYLDSTDYYNYTEPFRLGIVNTNIVGYDWFDGNNPSAQSAIGTYNLNLMQQRAIQTIRAAAAGTSPLYLYLAYMNVHVPMEAAPAAQVGARCDGVSNVHRKMYCGMMVVLDDAIGGVVAELKAQGMWANTLVTFGNDNGGIPDYLYATTTPEGIPFPAAAGSNWPLRAGKGTLYEGGVRGVAAISGGVIPRAQRGLLCPALAHAVDFPATVMARAGVSIAGLDGRDLFVAALANCTNPYVLREQVPLNILQQGQQYSAIISRNLKLILGGTSPAGYDGYWMPGSLVPQMPLPPTLTQALFDLDADPYETTDLYASRPADVAALTAAIAAWVASGYVEAQRNNIIPWALPGFHDGNWVPFLPVQGSTPPVAKAAAISRCRSAAQCSDDCRRARGGVGPFGGATCACWGDLDANACRAVAALSALPADKIDLSSYGGFPAGSGRAGGSQVALVSCPACASTAECDTFFTTALCDATNVGQPAASVCTCPSSANYTCPVCGAAPAPAPVPKASKKGLLGLLGLLGLIPLALCALCICMLCMRRSKRGAEVTIATFELAPSGMPMVAQTMGLPCVSAAPACAPVACGP